MSYIIKAPLERPILFKFSVHDIGLRNELARMIMAERKKRHPITKSFDWVDGYDRGFDKGRLHGITEAFEVAQYIMDGRATVARQAAQAKRVGQRQQRKARQVLQYLGVQ